MGAAEDLAAFFDKTRLALAQSVGMSAPSMVYSGMTDAQKGITSTPSGTSAPASYPSGPVKPAVVAPVVTSQPFYQPAMYGSTNTPYATGFVDPKVQTASAARDARVKEKGQQQWSNDPTIAGLEQRNWDIYIETGRWDSAEQVQLHTTAEEMRKNLNPLYPGNPWGVGENKYILPTDQFPTANSMDTKGLLTYGALGLGAVMILSMFRR
jgi:hypothetical protein